ncbi:hypothetical protein B0A48_13585 [Cryoendolithus antarcticus]|uniref:Pal1 cell morphology protein n=1 Tax=Cryoendolithus antarcticus TaxID=1507870 RepID=A0A1V8SPE2_9PEZI|nr:hypothetical protein B0A48_13585 [Cryoendolithus antarcticus]
MAAVMPDKSALNLSSNNPFRNRAASPAAVASTSPRSLEPPAAPPSRDNRMSRNPFLDASELSLPKGDVNGLTSEIFNDLSLLDKNGNGASVTRAPPPRAGTLPVNGSRQAAPSGSSSRPNGPPPPYAGAPRSPDKREPPRRPRGMSESSVMDKERDIRRERERADRPPRTESEERRRRERRREREERHKREKEKVRAGAGGARMKKPQGLDIIDQLDVTGIYGQGLFHHDGPFDACNPHRNHHKARGPAPMQAFPANSANMALGGSGPLNSRIDLDRFHGRGEEAFEAFTTTRKPQPAVVDPTARAEPVHGEETVGLGTSTFLEGAPASRRDLQRRESEDVSQMTGGAMGGGLSRKKSIAQRFRGMSNTRRTPVGDNYRSPDARYELQDGQMNHLGAQSAGGPVRAKYTRDNEINPFDNDYENAYEKKGAQIKIAESESRPLVAKNSPPRLGGASVLTRSVTADSGALRPGSGNGDEGKSSGGGGFLNRMKSLKGGRRARPDRGE